MLVSAFKNRLLLLALTTNDVAPGSDAPLLGLMVAIFFMEEMATEPAFSRASLAWYQMRSPPSIVKCRLFQSETDTIEADLFILLSQPEQVTGCLVEEEVKEESFRRSVFIMRLFLLEAGGEGGAEVSLS